MFSIILGTLADRRVMFTGLEGEQAKLQALYSCTTSINLTFLAACISGFNHPQPSINSRNEPLLRLQRKQTIQNLSIRRSSHQSRPQIPPLVSDYNHF
jgi:hypothetical protein